MKSIIKIIFVFLFSISLSACQDFLDVKPITTLTSEAFYKTPKDIKAALISTYSSLTDNGVYGESMYLVGEVRSDNAFPNQTSYFANLYRLEIDNFNITASNQGIQQFWQDHYRGIIRSNIVINYGKQKFASDSTVQSYVNEAKVLRALYYFNLVRVFGPVPIVLDVPTQYTDARDHVRESTLLVYKQIITDLNEALSSGKLKTKDKVVIGRITIDAAKVLLAKVFISLPDIITQNAYTGQDAWKDIATNPEITSLFPTGTTTKWEAAHKYLKEIYDAGLYSLVPNFSDLFKSTNKHNAESIWEVEYKAGQSPIMGSSFYDSFAPAQYSPRGIPNANGYIASALASKGKANCSPTGDLMNFTKKWDSMWPDYTYQVNTFNGQVYSDLRVSNGSKILNISTWEPVNTNLDYIQSPEFPYDPYSGTTWRPAVLGNAADGEFMCAKYLSPAPYSNNDSEDNWYIFRYADVLLMLAETENEMSGTNQTLLDNYINKVRIRAGIIPYLVAGNSSDAWVMDTQDKLRKAIQEERRLELAFEGHRWFDLVRTGTAMEVMNKHFSDLYNAYTTNPSTTSNNYLMKDTKVVVDERCILFPIPSMELLVNPKLTQNAGAR